MTSVAVPYFHFAFSPDGKLIVGATQYGECSVWRVDTGAVLARLGALPHAAAGAMRFRVFDAPRRASSQVLAVSSAGTEVCLVDTRGALWRGDAHAARWDKLRDASPRSKGSMSVDWQERMLAHASIEGPRDDVAVFHGERWRSLSSLQSGELVGLELRDRRLDTVVFSGAEPIFSREEVSTERLIVERKLELGAPHPTDVFWLQDGRILAFSTFARGSTSALVGSMLDGNGQPCGEVRIEGPAGSSVRARMAVGCRESGLVRVGWTAMHEDCSQSALVDSYDISGGLCARVRFADATWALPSPQGDVVLVDGGVFDLSTGRKLGQLVGLPERSTAMETVDLPRGGGRSGRDAPTWSSELHTRLPSGCRAVERTDGWSLVVDCAAIDTDDLDLWKWEGLEQIAAIAFQRTDELTYAAGRLDPVLNALTGRPHLLHLRELSFAAAGTSAPVLAAFLRETALPRLRRLAFHWESLGRLGCTALADASLPSLVDLFLDFCIDPDDHDALVRLASSPLASRVERVSLRGNLIASDTLASILDCALYSGLRALDLGDVEENNPIGDAGAIHIANSVASRSLEWLNLSACNITENGAAALVASEHFVALARLHLGSAQLDARTRSMLEERFDARVVFDDAFLAELPGA